MVLRLFCGLLVNLVDHVVDLRVGHVPQRGKDVIDFFYGQFKDNRIHIIVFIELLFQSVLDNPRGSRSTR